MQKLYGKCLCECSEMFFKLNVVANGARYPLRRQPLFGIKVTHVHLVWFSLSMCC